MIGPNAPRRRDTVDGSRPESPSRCTVSATPATDDGMKLGAGHPMGPLTLCDFIGLDVLYAVCDSLYEEFKRPEYAPPPLLKRMVVSGHHGRKSGRGFYEYAPKLEAVPA